MSIVLSEMYQWLAADNIISTSTAEANAPAANAKSPNLAYWYQDTTSATSQGMTWNFNGSSVSAWGMVVAGMNRNAVGDTPKFTALWSTDAVYAAVNIVATAQGFALGDDYIYTANCTVSRARADAIFFIGIDTLDDVARTGAPIETAHKSGRFNWVHTSAMSDGFHRCGYMGFAINPLVFPNPHSRGLPEIIELKSGAYGYRVSIGWHHLPWGTTGGVSGLADLSMFVGSHRRLPIAAVLDDTGVDSDGFPHNAEAAPHNRMLARIVSFTAPDTPGAFGTATRSSGVELVLETWEEQGGAGNGTS